MSERFTKTELLIFLILLLLGAALRLYALNVYPAGFHGDEAWTGLEARRILQHGFIGFWSPAALGQPSLMFYWTAIIFKFFGSTITTTRMSFTILNIFWIPFFYLVVRFLFNKNIAIIATLLLVTGYAPLALSRRADLVAVNFTFFPAIFFFLLAQKTKKYFYFVLTGIFLGLSHHIYFSFWVTPIAILILVICDLFYKKTSFTKKYLFHILILFLCYIIIAAPMLLFATTHMNKFLFRSQIVSIFSSQKQPLFPAIHFTNSVQYLLFNTFQTIFMFTSSHDPDIWSIFAFRPALDWITGIFFILGFFACLQFWKKREFLFVYILFFFSLIGSIINVDAPNYRRSQVAIYLSYIFAAQGIIFVYKFISTKVKVPRNILSVLFGVLCISISIYNIALYFKSSTSHQAKKILAYPLVAAANYVHTLPSPTYIYFFSACCSYSHQTLQFLLPGVKGENKSREFSQFSLQKDNNNINNLFLFYPSYLSFAQDVEKLYPGGQKIIHTDTDGTILFISYFLPNK